jgi:protein TonB
MRALSRTWTSPIARPGDGRESPHAVIRSTSLGLTLSALAVSAGVHAAAFAASARPRSVSEVAPAEPISVDVLTDPGPPVTPEPDATFSSPVDRPVSRAAPRANTPAPTRLAPTPARPAPGPPAPSSGPDDDVPHFSIAIGPAIEAARGVVPASSVAPGHEEGAAPASEDSVDVRAHLARGLPPVYPRDARAAGIEGDVLLELIVGVSGAVESARVTAGVGNGLDESALRAASAFRFEPASKGGRPVRVRMRWPVRFRLD